MNMHKYLKVISIIITVTLVCFIFLMTIGYFAGFVKIESHGILSDYDDLSPEKKSRVMETNTIDSLRADGNVYRVKPAQVKRYLADKEKAVVYSYIPYCDGKDCTEPIVAYKKCRDKGVELILISELYYQLFENTANYPNPVFVIDTDYFKTTRREQYVKLFYNALVGPDNWNRLTGGIYFCFRRGRFVKQCNSIDDAIRM